MLFEFFILYAPESLDIQNKFHAKAKIVQFNRIMAYSHSLSESCKNPSELVQKKKMSAR